MEEKPRRGPKKGTVKLAPRNPEKVLRIAFLREDRKLEWEKIGQLMGETRQGPFLLYKRWQTWAKEQKNDTAGIR